MQPLEMPSSKEILLPRTLLLEARFWGLPREYAVSNPKEIDAAVSDLLVTNELSFSRIKLKLSAGCMAIIVEGLADVQNSRMVEIRGPKVSSAYDLNNLPTPAAVGFSSAQGVELKDMDIRTVDGEKFLFVVRNTGGKRVEEILPPLVPKLFSLLFADSTPWMPNGLFPHPPTSLSVLLDNDLLTENVDGTENVYPHENMMRVCGADGETAAGPEMTLQDYVAMMNSSGIEMLPSERKKVMENLLLTTLPQDGTVKRDREVMERNAFIYENPMPFLISIDPEMLDLPSEVFAEQIKKAPGFLAVESGKGQLMPYLVGFIDGSAASENEKRCIELQIRSRLSRALKIRHALHDPGIARTESSGQESDHGAVTTGFASKTKRGTVGEMIV